MSKVVIKVKKEKIVLSKEDMIKRKEVYYMLLTSLNTVLYCIAEINIDTLKHEHKTMFKNLKSVSQFFLDNVFSKASRKEDIELLKDISFNNVSAAVVVFGLISKMPQDDIDWFIAECEKLLYVSYNRENKRRHEKSISNNK